MKTTHATLMLALACLPACDREVDDAEPHRVATVPEADDEDAAPPRHLAQAPAAAGDHEATRRTPAMPGAKAAFMEIATIVERDHVGGAPGDDELWTGAIEGMLSRLSTPGQQPVDVLLSPQDADELMMSTKGKLVGVGIMIERVADVVLVKGVVDDSPASRAGLLAGDRILGIDGKRVRELELADVVARIRGEAGTTVDLFVQRDTEEWTLPLTRDAITLASVEATSLGDGLGYVRITAFAKDTESQLDARLTELRAGGARRLVLDLRACPGGLLDAISGVAEHFIAPGATVMTIEHRDGKREAVVTAEDRRGEPLPLVVLVGPDTASSAEILADALRVHNGATLVGDRTFGKSTIESIHPLQDGWALKLSVSRFITASAATGGVMPDVRIPIAERQQPAPIAAVGPADDAVLAAAIELLDRG